MRMQISAALSAIVLAGLALAGCAQADDRQLQGWVEAELIFVSPDEQGRVEILKVREGDRVKKGDLLFTVDDDLQKADVVVKKTAVTNAQQTFDRAKQLLKTATGTQKTFDDAEAALRQAKANLEWSQTRLARRSAIARPTAPSSRSITGRAKPCRRASRWWRCCRRSNLKMRFYAPRAVLPADQIRREASASPATAAPTG